MTHEEEQGSTLCYSSPHWKVQLQPRLTIDTIFMLNPNMIYYFMMERSNFQLTARSELIKNGNDSKSKN